MEIFLTILIILIFYLILITGLSLVRALFSIRKGKARMKEKFRDTFLDLFLNFFFELINPMNWF